MYNPIGALLNVQKNTDFITQFKNAQSLGVTCCQLCIWDQTLYTDEMAEKINQAMDATGFSVSLLWAGYSGPVVWNFTEGPDTIGIVPEAHRAYRLEELRQAALFAEKIHVTDIATHVGFIPENPSDPRYAPLVEALKAYCEELKSRGQHFLFETGQETPTTLLRTIEAIGTGNAWINLDTANLILYGKANTADAVRVFGKYVRNTHIKDGLYPTSGTNLGTEVKVGEGLANVPEVIRLLTSCGYTGPYTIEREISGVQQHQDIADTVLFLEQLLSN